MQYAIRVLKEYPVEQLMQNIPQFVQVCIWRLYISAKHG